MGILRKFFEKNDFFKKEMRIFAPAKCFKVNERICQTRLFI